MRGVEQGPVPIAVPMDEARTQLRLDGGQDDAVLAAIERSVVETLAITGAWQRLALAPVRAITLVEGLPADGAAFAYPAANYLVDIDPDGQGWVRVAQMGAAGRMRITYQAGMASHAGAIPEVLRQGITMLAAHLRRERDRDVPAEPPAAVSARWRPWRRMRRPSRIFRCRRPSARSRRPAPSPRCSC